MTSFISIKNISKSFCNKNKKIDVISDFSLDVAKGDFIGMFGPNGCGKTTLINLISGIIVPDKGEILIEDRDIKTCNIGLVFQNYAQALLPWRTNRSNITFPLEVRGMSEKDRNVRLEGLINELKINFDLNAYPYQLSGGQQQLLSIARALISEPDILLFDEPLSSLDFQNSLWINRTIRNIWEKKKVTSILISHNIEDAIAVCNKIVFLTPKPTKVYDILSIKGLEDDDKRYEERTSLEFIANKQKAFEIYYKLKDEFKID